MQLPGDLHFYNQEPHPWPESTLGELSSSVWEASKEQFELFWLKCGDYTSFCLGRNYRLAAWQPPSNTIPRAFQYLKKSQILGKYVF